MASPWPKTVLVTVGTPVDLFAQDGVDDTINTLVVQNLSSQPVRMGDREAAPVKTEIGFKLITDATVHAIRSVVAADKRGYGLRPARPGSSMRLMWKSGHDRRNPATLAPHSQRQL